ncbi:hypothetical protein HYW58_01715 [Candidatus Kaiserbacteria bacterium]|nr:hypothetical protein [Candidatus Kaiserbacteria bacterium]
MNKNVLISALVIIIVIALGFLLFANRAEAPQEESDTSGASLQVPAPGYGGEVEEMIVNKSENMTPSQKMMSQEETPSEMPMEEMMEETQASVVVVTYTDGGFSPTPVTVKRGGVVRFVNQSSGMMWVASAIHPTHSLYPEKTASDCLGSAFDQCRASGAGETWEFTFNETGTWGYHNHVQASKTGKVTVE